MGAIMRGCKQFFVEYTSDRMVCRSYSHIAGRASTIRGAKSIIRKVRQQYAEYNPRDFRVYDSFADVDEDTHVPCVYQED